MRRSRTLILLALILLVGVVGVYFLMQMGAEPEAEPTGEGGLPPDMVFVVIAAQDMPRGSTIPEDGVIVTRMPANLVVETMIAGPDEIGLLGRVVGRIARMDIARGIPLTEAMITEQAGDLLAAGSDAANAIPPGQTAIAIPMNRLSGVAWALRPGDSVDVLISLLLVDVDPDFQTALPNLLTQLVGPGGTEENPAPFITAGVQPLEDNRPQPLPDFIFGRIDTDPESDQPIHVFPREQEQRPRLVTQRLVENATVLNIGNFSLSDVYQTAIVQVEAEEGAGAAPPTTTTGGAEGEQQPLFGPDIITIIVSPQEALAINWAIKSGADLVLTLRSPHDTVSTETTSVTLQYIVETYNITVPTKLPYSLEPGVTDDDGPTLPNTAIIEAEVEAGQ
jgi:Flp pilus assembly protein CpaB